MADVATPRPGLDSTHIDLQIGPYLLTAATAFGPRLVSLRRQHGPELFAQLGDEVVIEHPDSGIYRFHGGHRLWAGPEVPRITYASDDRRCEVSSDEDGLTIKAPVDSAGLAKELRVTLDGERLVVNHRLVNASPGPISIAPWGITQFRLGGVALIPVGATRPVSEVQADRSLILWPYTSLSDPRLSMMERAAVVRAVPGPAFKIGSGPNPGRLGYLIDGHLFTKAFRSAGPGEYPDRGAVGQVFVRDAFCELESVGPIGVLDPGSSVSHGEVWMVVECADLETAYELVLNEAAM